jgi:hypothetical protein
MLARTGYPRAPKYYIIKWLTDYIAEYGIDGGDTVKHTDETVWEISRPNVITLLKLKKTTNKSVRYNSFTPLLKFTIMALAADFDLETKNKLF